jgi:hypothetical protein
VPRSNQTEIPVLHSIPLQHLLSWPYQWRNWNQMHSWGSRIHAQNQFFKSHWSKRPWEIHFLRHLLQKVDEIDDIWASYQTFLLSKFDHNFSGFQGPKLMVKLNKIKRRLSSLKTPKTKVFKKLTIVFGAKTSPKLFW